MSVVRKRGQPSALGTWVLVFVIPAVAGVAGWFWTGLRVSAQSCLTGEGGKGAHAGGIGLYLLILAGPIAIAWRERHGRPVIPRLAVPMAVCLAVSFVIVLLGAQLWWYDHNCYT